MVETDHTNSRLDQLGLVQRRIYRISEPLRDLLGFASNSQAQPDCYVGIDALMECPQHLIPIITVEIDGMQPSLARPSRLSC